MKRVRLPLLPLVFVVGCASAPPPAPKAAARPEMPTPTKMDDDTRMHFKKVMTRHGDDMTVLMWSILFLDTDGAAKAADELEGMEWIKKPAEGQEAKFEVPDKIYEIQDELIAKARKLSEIARSDVREPEVLATAFGDVANACVKCHSYYLYTSGPRRGDAMKPAEPAEAEAEADADAGAE